jgi:hypothetical protein
MTVASFDFDVTLKDPDTGTANDEGVHLLKKMLKVHDEIIIVSSRPHHWESIVEIRDFLRENIGRDDLRIFLCGDWKANTLKGLNVVCHIDDDPEELIRNNAAGIPTLLIGPEKDRLTELSIFTIKNR